MCGYVSRQILKAGGLIGLAAAGLLAGAVAMTVVDRSPPPANAIHKALVDGFDGSDATQ